MGNTKDGALKASANHAGLTVEEFARRRDAGLKRCMACKEWVPNTSYVRDISRHDGLATKCSGCRRVKVKKSTKGRVSAFKGHIHSAESRKKISDAVTGKPGPNKGIPRTDEVKAKIRASHLASPLRKVGEAHPNYKHGESQRALNDRRRPEYREWRSAVFVRDKFTCQKCGDARGGNLRAHHVKPFAAYPDLRYDVSNGLTLCHTCHELEHLKPESIRNVRKLKRGEPLWK